VLAVGTAAQASYSAIFLGLAVMLPALKARYSLSLAEAGLVLVPSGVGSMFSFLPWGFATDRFGERIVAPVGLAFAAAALFAAGRADDFPMLVAMLGCAGFAGASVNAASGRAVMHWFAPRQRGLALGIRQAAIPIGGAAAAFGLPAIVAAGGVRAGFDALAAGCFAGALISALFLREGKAPAADGGLLETGSLRDRRIWRLLAGSFLLLFPQTAVFGFTVLFLHEHRGFSPGEAARVFALVQVLGIAARILVGQWSDAVGSRIGPLRAIAVASGVLAAGTGMAAGAPRALLLPLVVVGGVAAMSWNGLSFTAAAEFAGRARSGASLGLQQTVLAVGGALLPAGFAALAARAGWGWAWGLTAAGPLAAAVLLRGLRV
jgi:sugar phosphate permease